MFMEMFMKVMIEFFARRSGMFKETINYYINFVIH